jgi:hypothetical protein
MELAEMLNIITVEGVCFHTNSVLGHLASQPDSTIDTFLDSNVRGVSNAGSSVRHFYECTQRT